MTIRAILAAAKPGNEVRSWGGTGEPLGAWSSVRDRAGELSWVLSGKLALMGANAALMLFLARVMELKLYGLLVVAISGQLLLSRFLLQGVDFGMIRLRSLPQLREDSGKIVRAGLSLIFYATGAFALILVALWVMSFWLPLPQWPLWLVGSILAGAVGTALVDYNYCYRLSELQYRAAGLVQSSTGIGRLILTSAAVLLIPDVPQLVFIAYPVASMLSGLGLTAVLVQKHWLRPEPSLIRRLFRFSSWLGVAHVTVILSLYQGTFVLPALGQEAETGIFGLCLMLSMGFFALYNAFGEYVSPRMARLETEKELPGFLARALGSALAIATACIPIVIAMGMLLPRVLPPEFAGMSATFYFVAASMLLLIVQGPLEGACVYLLRPRLVVLGWVLRVFISVLLGVALASRWGALGVAVAQLGASIAALTAFAVFIIVGLRSAASARTAESADYAIRA